jgi:hypothetical protein
MISSGGVKAMTLGWGGGFSWSGEDDPVRDWRQWSLTPSKITTHFYCCSSLTTARRVSGEKRGWRGGDSGVGETHKAKKSAFGFHHPLPFTSP